MKRGLIKTENEINTIAEGGKLLRDILAQTAALVKPGISTAYLNDFAEKKIYEIGGRPSFKNYGPKKNPFPAGLCTSVNDVVVHGIPNEETILKVGDIVGLDIGMEYKELYTDHAITVAVGEVTPQAKKLMEVTQKCLNLAIKEAAPGKKTGDIGYIIQKTAEDAGFSVIRDLVGHGVGYDVHEEPAVPCYGKKNTGDVLKPGMVIAIEPMLTSGEYFLTSDPDGWTLRTADGSLAAHFEHTVAITDKGSRILT
ncbi:MAG: type I methionyl aminopeptidase [Candidatus Doudnabacteria bacterium]|nr:type I methionyl aminopeptidase [Candidatus Doudnabacteria bacterium]